MRFLLLLTGVGRPLTTCETALCAMDLGVQLGFKVWGGKIHFRGKYFCFYYTFKNKL